MRARRRPLALLVAAACLLAAGEQAMAASWPVYGKDLANSRHGDGPALSDVGSLAETWSFTDPEGDFTGTPTVAAGLVVAGSFAGNVHAVDAVTGEPRWVGDAGGPINGSIAIDPDAPDGGAVYVPVAIDHAPRLAALSLADGSLRWSTLLTDQEGSSVYGSPTYWNGVVYIGTSGPNGDDSTARGTVNALDAATGAFRWQTFMVPEGHDGGPVWSTPAIDTSTGRLYVGTGNAYHEPAAETTDAMVALDLNTGAILDHYAATVGDTFAPDNPTGPDVDFGASPNLIQGPDGQRLVGEGAKSGIYWALDRRTMDPVWSTLTGPGSAVGGIIGSTAYDGTRIYGNNAQDGTVWALNRDGSFAWKSKDTGPADFTPVAAGNGVVYTIDPTGSLVARDAATGKVLKKLSLGEASFGGASVVGGAIYVAIGKGPLPNPAPQRTRAGRIVAFGDTSKSTAAQTSGGVTQGADPAPPPDPDPDPGPTPQPGPERERIQLTVRPQRVAAGERTRFRFRARANGKPVVGAYVRFAGHRGWTGRRGRARISARLKPGTHRARATRRGFRAGSVTVHARRG